MNVAGETSTLLLHTSYQYLLFPPSVSDKITWSHTKMRAWYNISYHPVIQGNIRRFWQQGISDFQLPEAELRAIGVTNPAGLNWRMFPMNKRVVYYFTTMRLIGLEVVSCAWNFVTTPLANRMVRALATISLLLLFIFSFEYRHYVFHYCCAQTWIENAAFFYDVSKSR